jgi:hypothetical protein
LELVSSGFPVSPETESEKLCNSSDEDNWWAAASRQKLVLTAIR